jgi:N-acetylmuramoyl-L-alanine amidase
VASRRALRSTAATVAVAAWCLPVAAGPPASATPDLGGKTVFLDPGHGGAGGTALSRQVPNGRGGTKDCGTTGTAASDGFPEHTFTWDVVQLVNANLTARGVHTELSRGDDSGSAPCVDERARAANAMHPDAIVSIHADGGPAAGHGFHVNYSSPPLNDAQRGGAMQLATDMHNALVAAQFPQSTYIGTDGMYGRSDLAGLNLAEYPAILVELGNMKNSDDAAQMESGEGRSGYAAAVTQGIVAYLSGTPASS